MRLSISLLLAIASVGHGFNVGAQDSSCVIVRDGMSKRPIATARVRVAGDSALAHDSWTNAVGRVCWPLGALRSSSHIEAGALGYQDVSRDLRVGENAEVGLRRAVGLRGDSAATDKVEWRQGQMAIAIALARRDVARCVWVVTESCSRSYTVDIGTPTDMSLADSAASADARVRLQSVGLAFLENAALRLRRNPSVPQLRREVAGVTLVSFVDIPDSADRYTELRVGIPSETGRASFGATEMRCAGTDCSRHRQVSVTWTVDREGQLAPSMVIATDGRSRQVDAFDMSASTRTAAAAPSVVARMSIVRGVVRDEKERPLNHAQILASPDGNDTRTDSTGRFLIQVAAGGGGTVLTVRALGYAPAFRTVRAMADSAIFWEPRLRSVQLLAERVVRETGLPQELSSWRYDEMMARRAKGVGYFMIGQEIWSSNSLGDALARVPGVRENAVRSQSRQHCYCSMLAAEGLEQR
jgi:hypothetical protein